MRRAGTAGGDTVNEDELTDDVAARAPGSDPAPAPGGREAIAAGCCCSVLANAAFRAGAPGEQPFVDPECRVHTRSGTGSLVAPEN